MSSPNKFAYFVIILLTKISFFIKFSSNNMKKSARVSLFCENPQF